MSLYDILGVSPEASLIERIDTGERRIRSLTRAFLGSQGQQVMETPVVTEMPAELEPA